MGYNWVLICISPFSSPSLYQVQYSEKVAIYKPGGESSPDTSGGLLRLQDYEQSVSLFSPLVPGVLLRQPEQTNRLL